MARTSIALGRSSIGPHVGKHVLGCYAGITGITASCIAPFRNTQLFRTITSICFENDLAAPTASSHHCGITYLQKLAWQPLQDPKSTLVQLLQLTPASTQTADIWSTGLGREGLLSHDCVIQPDLITDMTKPPLCSWATGGTAMSSRSKSMSFNKQWIQVAIARLLPCAPRHFHFHFCSETRKAISTCNKITTLLILCSSRVLYICFLASKCLCYQDRKVAHDFCIKAAYCYQDGTRTFSFNLCIFFFSLRRDKVILRETSFNLNF